MGMIDFFKTVLIVQLFWAFSITLLVSTIPTAQIPYINMFTNNTDTGILSTLGGDLEDNLTQQTNIPIIDIGALVFYSGNLLLDLMLNFFTAVPAIFTLLLSGLFLFAPLDYNIIYWAKTFAFTIIAVIYFMGLMSFLMNIRSGGGSGVL